MIIIIIDIRAIITDLKFEMQTKCLFDTLCNIFTLRFVISIYLFVVLFWGLILVGKKT